MERKHIHTRNKKMLTVVNIILDTSGSMGDCKAGTIEGFNSYIKKLAKEDARVLVSLTVFNTHVEKRYSLIPLATVPLLTNETYITDGGTALYDATVDTIEEASERIAHMGEKPVVLTVIITDGLNNSSVKHDRACLTDLIERLKKEDTWSFVFLGSNQDSWANAKDMGMSFGNTANYVSDNAGMVLTMDSLYVGTSNFIAQAQAGGGAGGTSAHTSNFFNGLKDTNNFVK